jgi:hypothetical protein
MNDNDLNYATAQDPAAYVRAPVPPTPRELAAALVEFADANLATGTDPHLVVCGIRIDTARYCVPPAPRPSQLAPQLRRALEQLIREQRGDK